VIKKWLSYREQELLGRPLKLEEVTEVTHMARRIAAILLLEPQGKRISNPIDTTVLGFIQNAKKFKSTTLGRRVGLTFWLLSCFE